MAWEDALVLVRKRGQYMQEACDAVPSTMASVLGLDEGPLGEVCAEAASEGVVVMANFNSPGQIVIAGSKPAVAKACELAKAKGAKRCIELSVAGAFHSPLMEPARERLAREIAAVKFSDWRVPVVANVTARPAGSAVEAKELLVKQLTAPVRWADSMQWLVDGGCTGFYELGPGEVLAGLLKRVAKDQPKVSIGTAAGVAALAG
jgi:[acyl-carrier-protein] S-malonyltransferase